MTDLTQPIQYNDGLRGREPAPAAVPTQERRNAATLDAELSRADTHNDNRFSSTEMIAAYGAFIRTYTSTLVVNPLRTAAADRITMDGMVMLRPRDVDVRNGVVFGRDQLVQFLSFRDNIDAAVVEQRLRAAFPNGVADIRLADLSGDPTMGIQHLPNGAVRIFAQPSQGL